MYCAASTGVPTGCVDPKPPRTATASAGYEGGLPPEGRNCLSRITLPVESYHPEPPAPTSCSDDESITVSNTLPERENSSAASSGRKPMTLAPEDATTRGFGVAVTSAT